MDAKASETLFLSTITTHLIKNVIATSRDLVIFPSGFASQSFWLPRTAHLQQILKLKYQGAHAFVPRFLFFYLK